MYIVKNRWTRQVLIVETRDEVAKIIRKSNPHVSRLLKDKKTTKSGWSVEKVDNV